MQDNVHKTSLPCNLQMGPAKVLVRSKLCNDSSLLSPVVSCDENEALSILEGSKHLSY